MSRAAIDMIGLAGFNYDFNTLQVGEDGNELAAAFQRINSPKKFPLFFIVKGFLPLLRVFEFDYQSKQMKKTRNIMRNIGLKLLADKQKGIVEGDGNKVQDVDMGKGFSIC
jgi:hypothetical protein